MSHKKGSQILHKQQEDSDGSNINPFDSNIEQSAHKTPKTKKSKPKKAKKSKKEKKHSKKNKKSRHHDDQQEDDYSDEINSMFDEEAESGDEDEEDGDEEAELGYEEERERFDELYKRPNATERLLERFEGKNQKEINAQYLKKAHAIRQEQELYPSEKDPKLYVIAVKPRSEDELVLNILNKARHFAKDPEKKLKIISVIALKKKFPGRIFVEAYEERHIYESLEGFNDVHLGKKIVLLGHDNYASLFVKFSEKTKDYKPGTFVRVRKGLYEGDLAKVLKVRKNNLDVVLVPRINVQEIKRKICQQVEKLTNQAQQAAKKEQLLKLFTNHKQKNYKQRPSKRQLFEQDFAQLKDIPGVSTIKLANKNGLIVLNYGFDEIEKVYGSYLPVQIMPFTAEGNFIEELKDDLENLATSVNFKKGQQVQIIAGDLEKHYGILVDIRSNIGIIQCKNKQLKGQLLEEPLEHISKRFKVGQRVKITSGTDNGKTGVIITLQPKIVQIWTDNSNSIKVSKRNLQIFHGETICTENVHGVKKHDLIKASKNTIGVVIETTKDNIKIINMNNVIQVVGNMDFDENIRTGHLVAVNKGGDEIKPGSIVIIREGANKGKKCRVVHIYRQFLFLFNQCFNRTAGITVQIADNCSMLAKNDTGKPKLSTKDTPNSQQFQQQQIKVGKTITLKTGALKGYKGIVKSIHRDKLEVRVVSKACTEWVPRVTLAARGNQQEGDGGDGGKTPSRVYGSFKGFSEQQHEPNFD